MTTPLLLMITVFLLLSAFFSGMEIAFLSQDKLKMQIDMKQKAFFASINAVFSQHAGRFITTLLIGNNIALVVYGIFMSIALEQHYAISSLWGKTILSTLIVLLVAEYIPKVVFRLMPNTFLKIFALPAWFFYIILSPVASVFVFISRCILRFFFFIKINNKKFSQVFSKGDLTYFLDAIPESDKQKDQEEIKIFRNALDFSGIKVRDCLVPRTEIIGIEKSKINDKLMSLAIESKKSKIIIYENTIDNILGYIRVSDMFHEQNIPVLREALFVPSSFPAHKLLQQLLAEKKKMAIVIDEFGGTAGVVTEEDIIEEIFGDIDDEFDKDNLTETQVNANEYIFSARLEIDTLNEKYGFELQESPEYETLAGLVLHTSERMPELGDRIVIDEVYALQILQASDTKIETVKLIVN